MWMTLPVTTLPARIVPQTEDRAYDSCFKAKQLFLVYRKALAVPKFIQYTVTEIEFLHQWRNREGAGMHTNKRKRHITYIVLLAAVAAMFLTGCTNEKYEDELAYRQVGINAMETGDYEDAVAAFNTALSLCSGRITETEVDICYYKAAALYSGGNIEEAYEVYNSLLDYDAKNADAYYLRGCLALQLGDYQQALTDYEAAVKYNANDYQLYISIYENLTAYNMQEDGENYLQQAFDIKGDGSEQLAWRGKIYYLLGEYENASAELVSAIKKGSVEANLTMAQVCEAQGDSETAESYYQTYVQSDAVDSTALNALAEIEMAKGNYTVALDYISQGLSMENVPNRKELLSNQIIACEQSGDFVTAWEVVQEYTSLYPEDEAAQREYIFLKNRQNSTEQDAEAQDAEAQDTEAQDTEAQDTEMQDVEE